MYGGELQLSTSDFLAPVAPAKNSSGYFGGDVFASFPMCTKLSQFVYGILWSGRFSTKCHLPRAIRLSTPRTLIEPGLAGIAASERFELSASG